MDKEDCIEMLLATLREPSWRRSNSVTDWDLKTALWKTGKLLNPDQVSALFADMKRRGLVACQERRVDSRPVSLWGIRITSNGEDWLQARTKAQAASPRRQPLVPPAPVIAETSPSPSTPAPPDEATDAESV